MSEDHLKETIEKQGNSSYYESLSKELSDKWDEWKDAEKKYGFESRKANKLYKEYMQLYELKQDIRMEAIGDELGRDWKIGSLRIGR